MEMFRLSRWTWSTLAVSVITVAMMLVRIFDDAGRLGRIRPEHLSLAIFVGTLSTAVFGWIAALDARKRDGRPGGGRLALTIAAITVAFVFATFFVYPGVAYWRTYSGRPVNYLRVQQIVLAMHEYQAERGQLPPQAIRGRDGRPLLSWRVAILPYLEEDALYKQFHLDEPWDGPHNLALLARMPAIYRYDRRSVITPRNLTYFQVLVGPGTAFERDGLRIPGDFPDGVNTIVIAEATVGVPWTKPDDLTYDPHGPLPALAAVLPDETPSAARRDWFCVGLMDGQTRSVSRGTSEATLRGAITRNGGETLGPDW